MTRFCDPDLGANLVRRKIRNPMSLLGELDQPIPNVSEDDVARVIHRDYPDSKYETITHQLGSIEGVRTKLAVLKLAAGKCDLIEGLVKSANKDYRDVIAWAEYPLCMEDFDLHRRSRSARKRVYDDDWAQYVKWLDGDS